MLATDGIYFSVTSFATRMATQYRKQYHLSLLQRLRITDAQRRTIEIKDHRQARLERQRITDESRRAVVSEEHR